MALSAEILNLSVPERVQLVHEIWDSIAEDADALPVSEEHMAEVERRRADLLSGKVQPISWDTIRSNIKL